MPKKREGGLVPKPHEGIRAKVRSSPRMITLEEMSGLGFGAQEFALGTLGYMRYWYRNAK